MRFFRKTVCRQSGNDNSCCNTIRITVIQRSRNLRENNFSRAMSFEEKARDLFVRAEKKNPLGYLIPIRTQIHDE